MHYYPFNIGDYQSHTSHLSDLEDLAYRRLLDWYYLHETPIPLDTKEIARQIRMRTHSDCIATVLQEYFTKTEDGWTNERANRELAKLDSKSQKATASAKARWDKGKDANALQTQSESNATQDTRHITQDTRHNRKATSIDCPFGVTEQTWADWVQLRKAKKAAISQTALNGIQREANKAGMSLEQALRTCCERGWQGFKADWVSNLPKPTLAQQSTLAAARTIFGDERTLTDAYIIESPTKTLT